MRISGVMKRQILIHLVTGIADRGASIRIPRLTVKNKSRNYFEDRRPASKMDPYLVTR